MMADHPTPSVEYGVTPTEIMASMPGIEFVRAIFSGKLPEPPIMQTVEPFDSTAEPGVVVIHSVPGFRHYNPIGSVHGGYAAILLDSAMGLAVHSMLPAGSGYTTLGIQDQFYPRHVQGQRRRQNRRPRAQCRPPRRDRRGAHYRFQGPAARACDDNVPGFRDTEGNIARHVRFNPRT
jgi:acyl-coenzyme A thioesterase PaaI-like protein